MISGPEAVAVRDIRHMEEMYHPTMVTGWAMENLSRCVMFSNRAMLAMSAMSSWMALMMVSHIGSLMNGPHPGRSRGGSSVAMVLPGRRY